MILALLYLQAQTCSVGRVRFARVRHSHRFRLYAMVDPDLQRRVTFHLSSPALLLRLERHRVEGLPIYQVLHTMRL